MAESPLSLSAYLDRLFRNAKGETWPKGRPPIWLQLIGIGVAVVWGWYTKGIDFVSNELSSLIFFSVAALFTVNVLWFLWNLACAPFRVAREYHAEIQRCKDDLQAKSNQIAYTLLARADVSANPKLSAGRSPKENLALEINFENTGPQPLEYQVGVCDILLDGVSFLKPTFRSKVLQIGAFNSTSFPFFYKTGVDGEFMIELVVDYGFAGVAPIRRLTVKFRVPFQSQGPSTNSECFNEERPKDEPI